MFLVRWVGAVSLVAALLVLATRDINAQETKSFKWNTFKAKDGKDYSYPEWTPDTTDNKKANLRNAIGKLEPPTGYKVTKGVLKVYKSSAGAPGSYETTPTLTLESNNPLALVPSGYQLAWGDDSTPNKQFIPGLDVKMEIRVFYQHTTNANDKFEADLPTLYSTVTVR